MKRLILSAVAVSSLSVFAQGAPPPAKAAPAPAPAAAPAPAPAKAAPAPAPAAAAPAPATKAGPAPVAAAAPAPMDMSKMGSAARKSKNEAAVKKEIEAFYKAGDELMKKKDFEGDLARIDFPVLMTTDTMTGVASSETMTREQFTQMMKPMWDNAPADEKMVHKLTTQVLSDSIVSVTDDFTMTTGKTTVKGRSSSLLIKVAGQWKAKAMTEAGWGDVGGPPAPAPAPAAAAPAPAPAPAAATPAPKPAPAPAPAPAPKK